MVISIFYYACNKKQFIIAKCFVFLASRFVTPERKRRHYERSFSLSTSVIWSWNLMYTSVVLLESHSTYITLSPVKNWWCHCVIRRYSGTVVNRTPPPTHTHRHAQKGRGLPHVFAFSFAIKMEVTWEIKCLDERTSISQCDVPRKTGEM